MRWRWIITAAFWGAVLILLVSSQYGFDQEVDLVVLWSAQVAILGLSGWILFRWFRHPDVSANGLYPKWLQDFILDSPPHSRGSR
jgi:hypothetical protein